MPATIGAIIIGLLLVMQLIGEIIEFKGKTAPEFMKWRKYFKRKREEKKALKDLSCLKEILKQKLINLICNL